MKREGYQESRPTSQNHVLGADRGDPQHNVHHSSGAGEFCRLLDAHLDVGGHAAAPPIEWLIVPMTRRGSLVRTGRPRSPALLA